MAAVFPRRAFARKCASSGLGRGQAVLDLVCKGEQADPGARQCPQGYLHPEPLCPQVPAGTGPAGGGVDPGEGVDPGDGVVVTNCPDCAFWKHDRHSTGRPCVGRNGTVVSIPQAEQCVRVSVRTRGPPLARFALHCLQRLGSFLKSLSWKNNCSPAVKMNSDPQSMHFNTLSVNSMAGFPEGGNLLKSAIDLGCAGPVSLSSFSVQQQGPGPRIYKRRSSAPGSPEDRVESCTIPRRCESDCCHELL